MDSVDFSKYDLNGPPFETYTHEYEMAGRVKEWKALTSAIQQYFERGGCQFIILLGPYGQGKSYTVQRVYKKFSEESKEFPPTLVVSTIKGAPLRAMEAEAASSQFGLDLMRRIFQNIGKDKLHEIAVKASIQGQMLRIIHKDSKILFSALADEDKCESAFYLLTGEAQRDDTSAIGMGRMINSSERAIKIFYDFLYLIKYAKYDHMLLLLDEFEYVVGVKSQTQLTKILATFRSMFDDIGDIYGKTGGAIASLVIVFAITPGSWQFLTDLEKELTKTTGGGGVAPFMQRLRPDSFVNLEIFSVDDTKEMIKIRLKKHRTVGKKMEDLYPFTDAAIEYIHDFGQRTPRTILQIAGVVIEDAIKSGLQKIDESDVVKILQKYPFPTITQST